MAALYDVFRTPQLKGETKVHYHARSMVTGKKSTRDLIQDITRQSAFKEGVGRVCSSPWERLFVLPFTSPCQAIME